MRFEGRGILISAAFTQTSHLIPRTCILNPWIRAPLGGDTQRKVRTPQGSEPANGRAGRPDGKCNREQTADGSRWKHQEHRQG